MRVVGIDFGTTHSAVALWDGGAAPRLATFPSAAGRTPAFRSILHFEPDPEDRPDDAEGQALRAMRRPPRVRAGPRAIERYLETAGDGRLVQSIKSFLASPLFERTEIFGSVFELEDLVGRLLGELRAAAEAELGPLGTRVVVGRPVRFAGDAFDAKLVRERVAPALGRGSQYRNPFGEVLPVPAWLFAHLERWHHLSFLKSPATLALLADLEREALEPGRLRAFRRLVCDDRGFHVYRAVESAKHELSQAAESRVRYRDAGFAIDTPVRRAEFEAWIAGEIAKIERAVDEALAAAGLEAARGGVNAPPRTCVARRGARSSPPHPARSRASPTCTSRSPASHASRARSWFSLRSAPRRRASSAISRSPRCSTTPSAPTTSSSGSSS